MTLYIVSFPEICTCTVDMIPVQVEGDILVSPGWLTWIDPQNYDGTYN